MAASPRSHLREQRHELDGGLGQAVDRLLPVGGIPAPREQPGFDQPLQTVGENIGSDPLVRTVEQLAIMAPVAEHYVPDDDQAPAITQDLQRQVDRATGTVRTFHRAISSQDCLQNRIRSEEHTSELQSLMRISYAVFCLQKKN